MNELPTFVDLTHAAPVNYSTLISSVVTTLYVSLVSENPLIWKWRQGKNPDADCRGPVYVHGAPWRQIESGKGILASLEMFKKYGAYLFTGRILGYDGNPVSGATLDFWHASTEGSYFLSRYEFRGKITTDSNGYFEILTVTPGPYAGRPGHFHCIITPSSEEVHKYEALTTQSYLCKGNGKTEIDADFNHRLYLRRAPHNRLIRSFSIPESNNGKQIYDFPPMDEVIADERERAKFDVQIRAWNDLLAASEEFKGGDAPRVVAGGYQETCLSKKGTLGLW